MNIAFFHGYVNNTLEFSKEAIDKESVIKHEGGKWVLYSKDQTEVLGRHDTKEEAEEQERAIQASKHGS